MAVGDPDRQIGATTLFKPDKTRHLAVAIQAVHAGEHRHARARAPPRMDRCHAGDVGDRVVLASNADKRHAEGAGARLAARGLQV